jgi:hypothetical protein
VYIRPGFGCLVGRLTTGLRVTFLYLSGLENKRGEKRVLLFESFDTTILPSFFLGRNQSTAYDIRTRCFRRARTV